jgi:adenylate cyclase, class 2
MDALDQETEVKFCLRNMAEIEKGLHLIGARPVQPRTHELNLRFDTPAADLARERQVLRLRQDASVRMTYKDATNIVDGAQTRREIEVQVADMDSARRFLEALGYSVAFQYEKYRTTYELEGAQVMLDELPYGNFVEIEGPLETLKPLTQKLRLNWEAAIPATYHELFGRVQRKRALTFRDLSFRNFQNIKLVVADLGVEFADS